MRVRRAPGATRATYRAYGASPRRRRAWAAENPGNQAIRRELGQALHEAVAGALGGDGALLDVGCGTGWWLRRLAEAGVAPQRLHGIDLLPERADAARRAVPGAAVLEGDARTLPYADRRFAAVTAISVLSSLPGGGATRTAVAEAWRVLAAGGVLVVWEPRIPTPLNPATHLVRAPVLRAATGVAPKGRTLTVAPPLARRLGRTAAVAYPRLAAVPFLRTHRLWVLERPSR